MKTYDLWLFDSVGEGDLNLSFGSSPRAVTGIEVLVNMFTLLFLTSIGSDLAHPEIGSEIGSVVNGNIGSSKTIFIDMVYTSVAEVVSTISESQDSSTPADEFLSSVDILDVSISGTYLSVSVELESASGTTRTVIIPVQTLV